MRGGDGAMGLCRRQQQQQASEQASKRASEQVSKRSSRRRCRATTAVVEAPGGDAYVCSSGGGQHWRRRHPTARGHVGVRRRRRCQSRGQYHWHAGRVGAGRWWQRQRWRQWRWWSREIEASGGSTARVVSHSGARGGVRGRGERAELGLVEETAQRIGCYSRPWGGLADGRPCSGARAALGPPWSRKSRKARFCWLLSVVDAMVSAGW